MQREARNPDYAPQRSGSPLRFAPCGASLYAGYSPGAPSHERRSKMHDRGLSEEQRMMRQSCRDFVDDAVIPFIRGNWPREWNMVPAERLPTEMLAGAHQVGIR